jgi:hypothetical protein
MDSRKNTVWHTESFFNRQAQLRQPTLRSLYPSQAWSMYRVLPSCKSVLDLGFGSADSMLTIRQISPDIDYTGVDLVPDVVDKCRHLEDQRTQFICGDFLSDNLLSTAHRRDFDIVQGWSFIYAFDQPYLPLKKMYDLSSKWCLFDIRALHSNDDITDRKLTHAIHDGVQVSYPLMSWPKFIEFVSKLTPRPVTVEFSTYYYPPNTNLVKISSEVPEPFVASIAIEK